MSKSLCCQALMRPFDNDSTMCKKPASKYTVGPLCKKHASESKFMHALYHQCKIIKCGSDKLILLSSKKTVEMEILLRMEFSRRFCMNMFDYDHTEFMKFLKYMNNESEEFWTNESLFERYVEATSKDLISPWLDVCISSSSPSPTNQSNDHQVGCIIKKIQNLVKLYQTKIIFDEYFTTTIHNLIDEIHIQNCNVCNYLNLVDNHILSLKTPLWILLDRICLLERKMYIWYHEWDKNDILERNEEPPHVLNADDAECNCRCHTHIIPCTSECYGYGCCNYCNY